MPPLSLRAEAALKGVSVYQVRSARSRGRGFANYAAERAMRARARQLELDPDADVEQSEKPHGFQGPFGPSPDPAWDYNSPTNTRTPPGRKYSQMARYSRVYNRLEVVFRDGTAWHWGPDTGRPVDELAWDFFRRSGSSHDYLIGASTSNPNSPFQQLYGSGAEGGWGSIVGQ